MASYTGVVKSNFVKGPLPFHLPTPDGVHPNLAKYWTTIYAVELTGYSAIGTDDYTYSVFVADRALVVDACFLTDPTGLSVGNINYNTMTLKNASTTMCSATTAYGIVAGLPMEIARYTTLAERTLAAGDEVTFKITGTVSGRVINHETKVYVVCHKI